MAILPFMMSACDWGVLGSSPVIIHPPIYIPTETIVEPKPVPTTPPTAKAVEGRPGFVFNPYTGNIVEVQGLKSGQLVRDPEDQDKTHTFYVP